VLLIQFVVSSAAELTTTHAPELWRRYLAIVLDGLRTPDPHPLPPGLSLDEFDPAVREARAGLLAAVKLPADSDANGPHQMLRNPHLLCRRSERLGATPRHLRSGRDAGPVRHWRTNSGLENRYPSLGGSRVRIPPPPPSLRNRLIKRFVGCLRTPRPVLRARLVNTGQSSGDSRDNECGDYLDCCTSLVFLSESPVGLSSTGAVEAPASDGLADLGRGVPA
jgi:hypothetical protein